MFQIPEGTFGTADTPMTAWCTGPGFKSRKERLGPLYPFLSASKIYRGFKSRKERLGLASLSLVVSNPGRNVWDVHARATSPADAVTFQIPEGTFGTRRQIAASTSIP